MALSVALTTCCVQLEANSKQNRQVRICVALLCTCYQNSLCVCFEPWSSLASLDQKSCPAFLLGQSRNGNGSVLQVRYYRLTRSLAECLLVLELIYIGVVRIFGYGEGPNHESNTMMSSVIFKKELFVGQRYRRMEDRMS